MFKYLSLFLSFQILYHLKSFLNYTEKCIFLQFCIWHAIFADTSVPVLQRIILYLCIVIPIAYYIEPIDFIPEKTLGLVGLIDDMLLITVWPTYLTVYYHYYVSVK